MTAGRPAPAIASPTDADIQFMHAQGNSAPMIAAKLGISRTRVHRALGFDSAYHRVRVWRRESC